MTPAAADLLELAAPGITDDTWCQGEMSDGHGGLCAIGHLTRQGSIRTAADAVFALELMVGPVDLWNDRPAQTAANVRDTFLRAARVIRADVRV